jgi:hypothetical protein
VSFASVLEALAGYLADRNGYFESVAAAQRIAIAEREISLESPGTSTGMGTPVATAQAPAPAPAPRGEQGGASPSMGRM